MSRQIPKDTVWISVELKCLGYYEEERYCNSFSSNDKILVEHFWNDPKSYLCIALDKDGNDIGDNQEENVELTERLKNTKEIIEEDVNELAINVDSRMVLEENKIINSNNSIHLNWNYSKDIPIPLDGKKRWIVYHSINENINSIKEISCSQDIIPTITDTIRYYAWTDEKFEMPKHPIELKN